MRLLAVLFLSSKLLASSTWYDQKLEGWYYFEDPNHPKKEQSQDPQDPITPQKAEELIEIEKQTLKQLLSLALLRPTLDNVTAYMERQKLWLDQSGQFAATWGKALLDDPTLGSFLSNPTTSFGIQAKKHFDIQKRKALLSDLSKDHFLVFFYKDDYFSAQAAKVVKLFSEVNNWKIKAVSLDGSATEEFPKFEPNKGIVKIFGVKATPSMFVVNPHDNSAVPVGAGLVSVSQLEEQIEQQFTEEPHE